MIVVDAKKNCPACKTKLFCYDPLSIWLGKLVTWICPKCGYREKEQ